MRLVRWLYGVTIFLSAFLLFVVEPMVAKQLLPLLGGSSAVWTTSLVFFQSALLLGYLYAHGASRRLAPARQAGVHILLLTAALLMLGVHLRPGTALTSYHPAVTVFWVLSVAIGLPYLALSATTPLLTAWYARTFPGEKPYALFALSNGASLLALVSYPTLIEPHLTMAQQTSLWTPAFFIFAILCGAIAWQGRRNRATLNATGPAGSLVGAPVSAVSADAVPLSVQWLWFALATGGGMLLVAVTGHLSENIAAIPLLWIPPLALYLLSFVLAFQSERWYPRWLMLRLMPIAVASMAYVLWDIRIGFPIAVSVPLNLCGLFLLCLFCHAELYARRPPEQRLTRFYLITAAGGAAGAIVVGLLAPLLLRANYDLACALTIFSGIALAATWRAGWGMRLICVTTLIACMLVVRAQVRAYDEDSVALTRSFYGTLRVKQSYLPPQAETARQLFHGTIEHGAEWFSPVFFGQPLTYYGPNSGVEIAMHYCCHGAPRRVGVIGLGTGTAAAYGAPGDVFRFYEINPMVERLARHWFTFLNDSPARTEVVLGDARLSMAAEAPQQYNVILVDAFSGDLIPVHLLTKQALALYRRHLASDGVIAFHVSNQYLNLEPVVAGLAQDAGLQAVSVHSHAEDGIGLFSADWVLVTANTAFLRQPEVANNGVVLQASGRIPLWTDSYSSVLPLMRWHRRK